jgi:hypothetical protein
VATKDSVVTTEPEPPVSEKKEEPAVKEPKLSSKDAPPSGLESKPAPVLSDPAPQPEEKNVPKADVALEANTNAKEMVARVSALPGVAGCSITFEDGLGLAGDLPEEVRVGGLCAMAPSVLQRIDRHTVDTKLGPLVSMTLQCRESQMSFFMKGNVCLTVLHAGGDLAPDTRNKLAEMAKDLSRTYSQPETVHVDH